MSKDTLHGHDGDDDDEMGLQEIGEDILTPIDRIKAKMFRVLRIDQADIAQQAVDGIDDHRRIMTEIYMHQETFECVFRFIVQIDRGNLNPVKQSYGQSIRRIMDVAQLHNAIAMGLLARLSQTERDILADDLMERSELNLLSYVEEINRWDMREEVREKIRVICTQVQYPTGTELSDDDEI